MVLTEVVLLHLSCCMYLGLFLFVILISALLEIPEKIDKVFDRIIKRQNRLPSVFKSSDSN